MDRRSLLQGILDEPDDDDRRLVYSDWLEDHGDPDRAEFIRAQIQLARASPGDANRGQLRRKADQLLSAHHREWKKEVPGWARHEVTFARGFIHGVVCTAASFAKRGAKLFENSPVQRVRFTEYSGRIAEVVAVPHSLRVNAVTLFAQGQYDERLTPDDVLALADSGWPAVLESLDLTLNWLGRPEMEVLTRASFPRLRTLNLDHNYLRQEGLAVLLHWTSLGHVRHLSLVHNVFRTRGMGPIDEMIRRSPNLGSLRELNVGGSIDPSNVEALTDSPTLAGLRILGLSENRLDDGVCSQLADSRSLTGLQIIDLRGNDITVAGVEALLGSRTLHSPCQLDLRQNRIDSASRESLRRRLTERFGPGIWLDS